MPKGIYFILWFFLCFFSFFLLSSFSLAKALRLLNGYQPNLDTYSLVTAIWKIWSELPRALNCSGWGQKPLFWDWLWTLTEYLCNETWYQQSEGKKLDNLQGLPYMPRIWWTLVQKRLRTVGEFLPTPKFSHWETLPALPHGRYVTDIRQSFARIICSGTSLQSRTTECRAASRLALPCI